MFINIYKNIYNVFIIHYIQFANILFRIFVPRFVNKTSLQIFFLLLSVPCFDKDYINISLFSIL